MSYLLGKVCGDSFLIDCGSQGNTTIGDRVFMADRLTLKYPTTPNNILAYNSDFKNLGFE